MIPVKAYIAGGILLALMLAWGGSCWYAHHSGYAAGNAVMRGQYDALVAKYNAASAKAETDARAKEQAQAKQLAAIDAQHIQEMKDAQANFDRTLAEQRAGTLQLRQRWLTCTSASADVSSPATGSSVTDAAADDRAASAARIVRAAAEADATIRALQAVVRSDRGEPEAQGARSNPTPLHP